MSFSLKKVIAPAAAAFLLAGCASTKLDLAPYSPMAIIDVEGSSVVWEEAGEFDYEAQEDEGGGVLATAANKLLNSKNPELLTAQDRMDYAEESLRRALVETCGVELIDKDKLLESNTYQYGILNLLKVLNTNTTAEGYAPGLTKLSTWKARELMEEIGAKSIISAEFEITKKVEKKKMHPIVSMKIKIQNERGKLILDKEFTAEGADGVQTYGAYNKYNKDDFVELINPLIDDVINRFAVEYAANDGVERTYVSKEKTDKEDETAISGAASTKLGKPASRTSKKASDATSQESKQAEQASAQKAETTAINLIRMGLTKEQIAEATGLSISRVEELEKAEEQNAAKQAADKKAKETAQNLLKMGLTKEQISEATGLTVEEVEELEKESKN